MSWCACRSGAGRASSPGRYLHPDGPGRVLPERLHLQLHSAELVRSFAKIGSMDPYVVVAVDGREVYRTAVAGKGHTRPTWNASCTVRASGMPGSLDVAVRSLNPVGKDVLCGSVSVACSEGMEEISRREFTLTKCSQPTGALRLSLSPAAAPTLLLSPARSLSKSFSQSFRKSCSSLMFDSVVGDGEDGNPELEDNVDAEDYPSDVEDLDAAADAARAAEAETAPSTPSSRGSEAGDRRGADGAAVLAGRWTCVATDGLEDFLKQAGLGSFQRKIALSARWPSWEFSVTGDRILFVNHAQLGDLREDIPLDGSTYKHKDLQGHPLTNHAKWERTLDGGVLTIWRECEVGPFYETRTVAGDTLTFVLTKEDGKSWGRTFKRAA